MSGCLEQSEEGEKEIRVEVGEVGARFVLWQNIKF